MSRSRARRLAPHALALFLAISIAPRAVLFTHHHAGGDHDHVHVWGEDAFEPHHHDHDDDAVAPHHHDHPDTGEVEIEAPDETHVHIQVPFQLAIGPVPVVLLLGFLVRLLPPVGFPAIGVSPRPETIARGPPSPALG